jgi:predicted enzyme related to lactoylglutathione lyase
MAEMTAHFEPAVTEMRLVVTTDDFDAALAFYRDVIGLPQLAVFESPRGRVTVLGAGRATLELSDTANARYVDEVEVGRRVAGPLRVAFEVFDTEAMTHRAALAGATVLAEPTPTPWGSMNARLEAPAGLQLTLFSGDSDLESTPESPADSQ